MRQRSHIVRSIGLAGGAPTTLAFVLAMLGATQTAQAQVAALPPAPQSIPGNYASATVASTFATFDLATKFLASPNGRSTAGANTPNPGGSGAGPDMAAPPRFRSWAESYGQSSRNGANGEFPGDKRSTAGGVAGVSAVVAQGLTLGGSIDQSRSWISVEGLPQSAKLDLTQLGVNATYENGPWSATAGVIRAFGDISTARIAPSGGANANYKAALWGVLGEASYFWGRGSFRVVPKFGIDYIHTRTDAFAETGGIDAAILPEQTADRTRVFVGSEVGNTWTLANAMLFDLSGYGRYYETVQRTVPQLTVSSVGGAFTPTTLQGVAESRAELTTGASASLKVSDAVRLYAAYDGRFRQDFESHTGTLGVEVRF